MNRHKKLSDMENIFYSIKARLLLKLPPNERLAELIYLAIPAILYL
jgi:hypothetical protein